MVFWNQTPLTVRIASEISISPRVPKELLQTVGTTVLSVRTATGVTTSVSVQAPPAITAEGVVSAVGGQKRIAPGSLVSIYGPTSGRQSPPRRRFRCRISQASVFFNNNQAAPVLFVSPGQINIQAPYELPSGMARLHVGFGGASDPVNLTVSPIAPAVLTIPGADRVLAVRSDGSLVDSADPAVPGESLVVYATGQGALDLPVESGDAAPAAPLSRPRA